MTWAQRLKRVFRIDLETCSTCGGAVRIIACIEDPVVIGKILAHLNQKATTVETRLRPQSRAPPAGGFSGRHPIPLASLAPPALPSTP